MDDTSDLENDLRLLTNNDKSIEERIHKAKEDGYNTRIELQRLNAMLEKGICSSEFKEYWDSLQSRASWFYQTAKSRMIKSLYNELYTIAKESSSLKAKNYLETAKAMYENVVSCVELEDVFFSNDIKKVRIDSNTSHALYSMDISDDWSIY